MHYNEKYDVYLDEEEMYMLDELVEITGKSRDEVIHDAIKYYYDCIMNEIRK